MLVRVAPLWQASEQAKGWANFVVSLVDPDLKELPDFDAVMHMSIVMEDTEVISDPWSPKAEDIAAVMMLADNKDHILVHCHGGISRSVSMGLGLLVSDGKTIDEAVKLISAQRPNMSPNKLILQHIDTHLNMSGKFVSGVLSAVSLLPKGLQLWCEKCQTHFVDGDNCPGKHWL